MASFSSVQFHANRCFNSLASSSCPKPRSSPSFVSVRNKANVTASLLLSESRRASIDHEKIEKWMPEAVVEIVKNLKQAPLLMQVYDGDLKTGLKTEKAIEEKWQLVKEGWREEEEVPEGVILVEEIGEEEDEKAWGIVIQGRGCECGPACYLLKTSRVRSGVGSGFCTHFCLTKVTSFRETALSQLTNSWLLR